MQSAVADQTLVGRWVRLEPLSTLSSVEAASLMTRSDTIGQLVLSSPPPESFGRFVPVFCVRARRDGSCVGLAANWEVFGYPDVAEIGLYVERPGLGLEAWVLDMTYLFSHGAHKCLLEVVDGNDSVLRPFEKLGLRPQAWLSEHAYAAGQFRDVAVYSMTADEWSTLTSSNHALARLTAGIGGSSF